MVRASALVPDVAKCADTGSFTGASTQVVELASSHPAAHLHLESLADVGCGGEDALNPDAVGDLSDGEAGAQTIIVGAMHAAFEDLHTLLFTLTDANVYTKRVSGFEVGDVLAHLHAWDLFDDGGGPWLNSSLSFESGRVLYPISQESVKDDRLRGREQRGDYIPLPGRAFTPGSRRSQFSMTSSTSPQPVQQINIGPCSDAIRRRHAS